MTELKQPNPLVDKIYRRFKRDKHRIYDESKHCKMLIEVMLDKDKGTVHNFCVMAFIAEETFYEWARKYEIFRTIFYYSKMVAKANWEEEGREFRFKTYPMGAMSYEFEYWKMIGWTRFGISKNSRIKINVNPEDSAINHYRAILKQGTEGDFTASEFKQLMEAVNVGLNVHQVFELQAQINELKSDLALMMDNKNVQNYLPNTGVTQKD